MNEIRVLIVDDSAFMRLAIERMISELPKVKIVGTATNGAEAVNAVKQEHPDVVILDVNMPEVDGLEALRQIMDQAPTNVLMLSTLTTEGAETTMRALELGAIDFLDKTSAGTAMDIYTIGPQLREKVMTVAGATWRSPVGRADPIPTPSKARKPGHFEVLVIGASTGGPRALADVLCQLPEAYPSGVVVAQHMPPGFTSTLAERLDRRCTQHVIEGSHGMTVEPGRVLLAPGGKISTLGRDGTNLVLRVADASENQLHKPSVNRLFESAARCSGQRTIGVILTGMGDDGAIGLKAVQDAGGVTIAESEETAVIYGMPRAAAPYAEQVLPLGDIGKALAHLAARGSWKGWA